MAAADDLQAEGRARRLQTAVDLHHRMPDHGDPGGDVDPLDVIAQLLAVDLVAIELLDRERRNRRRRADQDVVFVEEILELPVEPRLLAPRPADLLRFELQRRLDVRQHGRPQQVAVLLVTLHMARQEMHAADEPEDLIRRLEIRAALDALAEGRAEHPDALAEGPADASVEERTGVG